MNQRANRVWRPIAAGVLVVAVLVAVFSFAPSRAVAERFLSIFRVRKFAVVQVNPNEADLEQLAESLQDKLFAGEPEMITDAPVVQAATLEEARALAGFEVRLPTYLPGAEETRFEVKGNTQVAARVKREGLQLILQVAGMDPDQIPASVENGLVQLTAPSSVYISKGRYSIVQVSDPSVDYPDGLNPRLIGEASLRILGVPAEQAKSISERIDWTTTLLLPVPADIAEARQVLVSGAEGVLLVPRQMEDAAQAESQPDGPMLLLERDNIVYMVTGSDSPDELVRLAESMF